MSELARRFKLLVVGVGGQGAITVTRFLGDAAHIAGLDVMVGQLHGMSQRGGCVDCTVVIGQAEGAHIDRGEADVVLGLEPLETLRALPYMSASTRVVVNSGRIVPFGLVMSGGDYPALDDILAQVRAITPHVFEVDALGLVEQVGVPRTLNTVMLGALSGLGVLPVDSEVLQEAVALRVPRRFLPANREAFRLGLEAITQ